MFTHPSSFLRQLYPSLQWKVVTKEPSIYLTFDDGPTPGVTDWVLDKLKQYNAKATFFCIGKNVAAHPQLYQRIIQEGHEVGNHSYNHLNGWKYTSNAYAQDVMKCAELVDSKLFRPPYGKISPAQIMALKKDFKIVMWSVLSKDYHPGTSKERSLEITIKQLEKGDIIIMHDSLKAEQSMKYVLENLLILAQEKGWKCKKITSFD